MRIPISRAWALHVSVLLEEAGIDGHPALTDALLAPVAPDVFANQRSSGLTAAQIAEDLGLLARRVLG